MERDIAASYLEAALLLSSDDDDTDDEELVDQLLFAGMEPMVKRRRQVIGKERLSIERLRREAANTRNELPIEGDDPLATDPLALHSIAETIGEAELLPVMGEEELRLPLYDYNWNLGK